MANKQETQNVYKEQILTLTELRMKKRNNRKKKKAVLERMTNQLTKSL